MKYLIVVLAAEFRSIGHNYKELTERGEEQIKPIIKKIKEISGEKKIIVLSSFCFGSRVSATKIVQALGLSSFDQYGSFCIWNDDIENMEKVKKFIQKIENDADTIVFVTDKVNFNAFPPLNFKDKFNFSRYVHELSSGQAVKIDCIDKTVEYIS